MQLGRWLAGFDYGHHRFRYSFGTPEPIRSRVNLGVLSEEKVNIIVHGHEPTLSEMLAVASTDEELLAYARSKGATGINVGGICCTANEALMRHGLPIVANFLQQELAIMTGSVEMMVVDVQCVMPSLANVAKCFHTELVSTSHIAETMGAEQITFDAKTGLQVRRDMIRQAIDNFERRDKSRVHIPHESMEVVAGFSNEAISHMLAGNSAIPGVRSTMPSSMVVSARGGYCGLHESQDPVRQRAREVG